MGNSKKYYDEIAEFYDSMYEEPYWYLYHNLLEKLIMAQKPKGNILDIGTGTGRWAIYLAKKGNNIKAIDISKKMLSVAKQKANAAEIDMDFLEASGEELPFSDNYFNVVTAFGDVLSYTDDFEKMLKEVKRVLVPGGKLLATVDNGYAFLHDFVSNAEMNNARNLYENRKKVVIGDSQVSKYSFLTRPFFPEEIETIVKRFDMHLIDLAGVVVFYPYVEKRLSNHIDEITEWEYAFCRKQELLGRCEHLFFCAKKEK
ncbi:MAG: class I SAM-dependent methyltransferase [Kosmotoga sp.]|nr:MAG: class I SAM-dependent methyltransferase [Kosmotoga sp.]